MCFSTGNDKIAEIRTKKALALIVGFEHSPEKNRPPRQRKHKTREWMKKRIKKGLYANLILELSAEDPLGFREIMRMSRGQFHEILGKVEPAISTSAIWIAQGSRIGDWPLNSDWSLQYNIVERATTRFNICCVLEKMFDRNQNILPTKNVEQTSSNMHATRSNIADPTNVL